MRRAFLAAALLASPTWAWESVCFSYGDPAAQVEQLGQGTPCTPDRGPATARGRWVGPNDEHRRLFEKALSLAGVPAAASQTATLSVFTGATPTTIAGQPARSLMPVPFEQAAQLEARSISPAEFAQLPDFSYSLFDWASGHETCPVPGVAADAEECHHFASHMGPVNANHFLPQSALSYRAYHALAVARAVECATLTQQLASTGGRFADVAQACEFEALSLEAVGQHFLEDSWSSGHMWQRWGSADLSAFPGATPEEQRTRAVLVALVSGLIHGSRGVLQALPEWTSYDVDDALCAPNELVHYVDPDGAMQPAVGDDYLPRLNDFGGAGYDAQTLQLESCAVSGVLEVYRAAGEQWGPAVPTGGLASVQPGSEACFSQRVTNLAMVAGMAVDLKAAGVQVHIPLDARTVAAFVPSIAEGPGQAPVPEPLRNRYRLDLMRLVTLSRLTAKASPDGTELAEGALGPFLGVPPNGAAATTVPAYFDPPLPWPAPVGADAQTVERTLSLARTFHRAHAAQWCALEGPAQLAALKTHALDALVPAEEHSAACSACVEFAGRHLRVGTDAANYDTAREPLCHALDANAALIYQSGLSTEALGTLAQRWCGC